MRVAPVALYAIPLSLDAASKDPCKITLKMKPEYTRYKSGDRAQKQFGAEWGERILEGTLLVPEQSARQFADASVSELLLSELLGENGKDFRQWGLDDLAARPVAWRRSCLQRQG